MGGFPCSSAGKESTCNAEDLGSIPGLGRSSGEGKSYTLQYSGLENSMDDIVHGVAKSRTRLSDFHFHFLSWGWRGCVRCYSTFSEKLDNIATIPCWRPAVDYDTVDKNLPANAGDTGSIPGPGGFYMLQSNCKPQLLSPCMATTEACAP